MVMAMVLVGWKGDGVGDGDGDDVGDGDGDDGGIAVDHDRIGVVQR